jgi:hypothetical protein
VKGENLEIGINIGKWHYALVLKPQIYIIQEEKEYHKHRDDWWKKP